MIALSLLRSHHYKGQLNTTMPSPFEYYKNPTKTKQKGGGRQHCEFSHLLSLSKGFYSFQSLTWASEGVS